MAPLRSPFVAAASLALAATATTSSALYTMDLLPGPPASRQVYNNASYTSWGGSVVEVPEDSAYRFHLFAAFMILHCGLDAWTGNSEVVHAVSNNPLGPFVYADVALPVWHHNPQIVRNPDGTFLLMSIGMSPESRVANCTPSSKDATRPPLTHGAELVEMHTSSSPYGPWTPVENPTIGGPNLFNGTNPSPWVFPNGTIVVASHNNCGLTLSSASSYKGPYSAPECVVRYSAYHTNYTFEDPFLWYDSVASKWRVLLHQYNMSDTHDQVRVGGYAESAGPDPYGPWTLQPDAYPVYNTTVQYTDGTAQTFSRRERPKILFNATTGLPAYLYTGVCPLNSENCFTLGQPIGGSSG
jgi:hypothetical protein